MIEPIDLEFRVDASPSHAFDVWVRRPSMWWPKSHSHAGDGELSVVFEERVGGRIYERSADGTEHAWGEVTEWDPPHRISYLWHLFFDRSEATSITLTFTPEGEGTSVRLVQDGFDRLGEPGQVRRERTVNAWQVVTGVYREFLAS